MLFFGVNLLGADEFYSDSLLVFVHVFNLALIAFIGATIWTILSKPSTEPVPSGVEGLSLTKFTDTKFYPILLTLLRYFVALNLLVYGFSKLYKWQFMLPEPNILYTKVGDMHRDILYWTSMGSSRSYTMFMGVIEIVPAILLLFRRTTLIGAFVAALVMTNVVAVNFGFDITVKLHSMMLLIMALVILIPGGKRIVALFTGKTVEEFKYPALTIAPNRKWISPVLKIAAIALLIAESHYPYTKTGTYNDDVSERPPMCGAYEVTQNWRSPLTEMDSVIIPARSIHHIFIHRRGYMILEYSGNVMEDYPLTIDTVEHKFILTSDAGTDEISWRPLGDSIYEFAGTLNAESFYVLVKKLDWEKMPLMQNEFTLIDED